MTKRRKVKRQPTRTQALTKVKGKNKSASAPSTRPKLTRKERHLDKLIDDAMVDSYGDDEQRYAMIVSVEEHVECPFQAKVMGEPVTVIAWQEPEHGYGLKAVCRYKGGEHLVDLTTLEFVRPHPEGYEWIEAYDRWRATSGLG